jgi:hypothetical protein
MKDGCDVLLAQNMGRLEAVAANDYHVALVHVEVVDVHMFLTHNADIKSSPWHPTRLGTLPAGCQSKSRQSLQTPSSMVGSHLQS